MSDGREETKNFLNLELVFQKFSKSQLIQILRKFQIFHQILNTNHKSVLLDTNLIANGSALNPVFPS